MDKPFKRKAKRSRRGPNVQQWELWSQWGQSAEITARPHDTASVCHLSKEHNWSGASGPSNGTLWAHTFCNSCVLDESPHAALHQHYLAELSWFRNSERNTARGRPGCHFTALVYAKGEKKLKIFSWDCVLQRFHTEGSQSGVVSTAEDFYIAFIVPS